MNKNVAPGMKRRVAGIGTFILLLALVGCGSGNTQQPASSETPSASPSPTNNVMPGVAGKSFKDVSALLASSGIAYSAVGSDGGKFSILPPNDAIVDGADVDEGELVAGDHAIVLKIQGTEAEVEARAAAAKTAALRAVRYDFNCQKAGIVGVSPRTPDQHFHTVQAVWADPDYKAFESCDGNVAGRWWHDKYILEPDEQAVVNQIGADGGDISSPSSAYSDVLEACLLPPKDDWGKVGADNYIRAIKATAMAAVRMCPDAPFVAQLKHVASGDPDTHMKDGSYTVGKDIAAGTYQVQTTNGVRDCYWERTGAQGGTIANDFITFAPQGPTVTVFAGEGFVSRSCGTWQKID